jgi:hypothetical protein
MLSEARCPFTELELKLMILFSLFIIIIIIIIIIIWNLSHGFINKSTYKSQDTHSSIQISYLTNPMLKCACDNQLKQIKSL